MEDAKITRKGYYAWAVTWLALMAYALPQLDCFRSLDCGDVDLFWVTIIGFGCNIPGWFVAFVVSSLFSK